MKLCLPIREHSQERILEIFQENQNDYDLFEVWLDAVQNLKLESLIKACPKPLLCVCKAQEEKGEFQGDEEERVDLLIHAAKAGAKYIDIGIHTDPQLIQKAQKEMPSSVQLILSCHNWDKTPKLTSMLTRIDQMMSFKPDYIKYVATAHRIEDNIHIFRLAENLKKKGQKYIVMCMGQAGKISRIVTPMLGSAWSYAPKEVSQSSAVGQITKDDLRKIWSMLV